MANGKAGRPPKTLTEEQRAQVEALAAFLTQEQIADYFAIARNTFLAMCERETDILERYKRGKARAIGGVAKNLIQQAQAGNVTAAIFYLKTRAGWVDQTRVDHTSSDGSMTPPARVEIVGVRAAGGDDAGNG